MLLFFFVFASLVSGYVGALDADFVPDPRVLEVSRQMRDPFHVPDQFSSILLARSELETTEVSNIKLMGIITGPERWRAIVSLPSGKTMVIQEKMKIGSKNGVVKRIHPHRVEVLESYVNALGQTERIVSELRLPSERDLEGAQ